MYSSKKDLTPEEKLLKVIDTPGFLHRKSKGIPEKLRMFSIQSVKNRFSQLLKQGKGKKQKLTLSIASRWLLGLCVVLTLCWLADFVQVRNKLTTRLKTMEQNASADFLNEAPSHETPFQVADVIEQARKHNIFTLAPPPKIRKPKATTEPAIAEEALEFLEKLQLVGIMWSETPQAIVENIEQEKTLLLGIGESIGKFEIREILKDKVILGMKGSENTWELQ
jgi:type II secretory pathway component PulC